MGGMDCREQLKEAPSDQWESFEAQRSPSWGRQGRPRKGPQEVMRVEWGAAQTLDALQNAEE